MTTIIILIALILAVTVVFLLVRGVAAVLVYRRFRGKRLITCPETHAPAAVEAKAASAAICSLVAESVLRLDQCSRWPERQNCGQECLQQVEADPERCLVWNIVSDWYEGKRCVYCHKLFSRMTHLDHAPALRSPAGLTTEWNQIRTEQLPEVFATHSPVCWNCHVTETFRRVHPELVVNRS